MLWQTFRREAEHTFSQSGTVGNTDKKTGIKKYDHIVAAMDGKALDAKNCQHGWTKKAAADFCLYIW